MRMPKLGKTRKGESSPRTLWLWAGEHQHPSATKIKQRWFSGGRQKDQPGFVAPEELCLFAAGSHRIQFLSFVAWGIFCPHRTIQLWLFSRGHRLPDGAETQKFHPSEMMSFSWVVEKKFCSKTGTE